MKSDPTVSKVCPGTLLPNFLLPVIALFAVGCSSGSGPVEEVVPEGIFLRIETTAEGEWHRGMRLEPDSAFVADTLFVDDGSGPVIDSIRVLRLELDPSADGYFRAVEEEETDSSGVIGRSLRYWYFFQQRDSLFYYRGMRLRGDQVSLQGTWNTSSADSAYLHRSYRYTFADDSVEIVIEPDGGTVKTSYQVHDNGTRTLTFGSAEAELLFGPRFEVVPGLALYLTSERSAGHRKIAPLEY